MTVDRLLPSPEAEDQVRRSYGSPLPGVPGQPAILASPRAGQRHLVVGSDGNRALLLDKTARYSDFYRKVIETGIADGKLNQNIAVLTILGALNWSPEWFSPNGRASASDVADSFLSGLLG